MECLPALTFQLAMFPSVIVGDIAGIVKFWPARILGQLRKPTKIISQSIIILAEANEVWDIWTDLYDLSGCVMAGSSFERIPCSLCRVTP